MAKVRYQVARVGTGFTGPGQKWLGVAIGKVRLRLRRLNGPFHYQGHPKQKWSRKAILKNLKQRVAKGHVGDKWIVMGKSYDKPGVAIRIIRAEPIEHPFVTAAKRFLGGTRYVFGTIPALPLPTTSDCSGLTLRVVSMVSGDTIPHSANLQMRMDRMDTFRDVKNVQSGDFIFYNFGRLPDGQADDVTLVVQPGTQIGARPSRGGVAIFDMAPEQRFVLCYGRYKS